MQSICLEKDATTEEVEQLVWDCDGSKVSGPNGFTFTFYKKAWNYLEKRIFQMVNDFFRHVYTSYIALLPKSKLPTGFSQYRPITLVHVLYKIVSKVLSFRLKTGIYGFMLKVDFHKASDSVLWDYLDEVMNYMNFGSKWRSLIH